jgi:hypothetical protein
MNAQATFDFRATDPDTSASAAALNATHRVRDRDRCLQALYRAGMHGATDFELETATGIKQTSCGKRRLELLREGLVERTDERRPSPTGSPAVVWRLTIDGRFRAEAAA